MQLMISERKSVDRISRHAVCDLALSPFRSVGILNRQSRAERQDTFDWLHILPVRVTISQYKSYSASTSEILPIGVIFCNHVLAKLSAV